MVGPTLRLRWLPERQRWTNHVAGAAAILQPCGSKQHGWSNHAAVQNPVEFLVTGASWLVRVGEWQLSAVPDPCPCRPGQRALTACPASITSPCCHRMTSRPIFTCRRTSPVATTGTGSGCRAWWLPRSRSRGACLVGRLRPHVDPGHDRAEVESARADPAGRDGQPADGLPRPQPAAALSHPAVTAAPRHLAVHRQTLIIEL